MPVAQLNHGFIVTIIDHPVALRSTQKPPVNVIIETFILRFDSDTDHVNLYIIEDVPSKLRKIWEYMLTKKLFCEPR